MDGGSYRDPAVREASAGTPGWLVFCRAPSCPPREWRSKMTQENLIERLMAENEEFRRLRSEHQGYEQELDALKVSSSLSADQHWRMSELKKVKLMAKDRVERTLRHGPP